MALFVWICTVRYVCIYVTTQSCIIFDLLFNIWHVVQLGGQRSVIYVKVLTLNSFWSVHYRTMRLRLRACLKPFHFNIFLSFPWWCVYVVFWCWSLACFLFLFCFLTFDSVQCCLMNAMSSFVCVYVLEGSKS